MTGPAESAGLRVEPGFVELVVQDVRAEPGALPLLSHALLETWKRRSRRTLTVAGYLDAGGAKGAIAQTAESVYRAFDHDEQVRARHIFLRLTELGDGTEDTARRMERNELAPSIDGPVTDRVLERMVDARLVTLDDHSAQVAHEALIREWPRLRGWLDEDREGRRVHRHLTHAARDWQALGFDAGELYRGTRLAALRDWATESGNGAELNALETDFLGASIAREEDERASQLDQVRARERSNRRLRRLLAVTAVVLGVALVAGTLAFVQRGRADDEAAAARSASLGATADRLVAQSNVQEGENRYLGALLALEADRIHDGPQARGAIFSALLEEPRRVLTMPTGPASDVAPLADGTALVLADGHVERWDLHLGTRLARWPGPAVAALAVSSAGLVAEGRVDGSIAFVDLSGHPREDAIPAGADGAPGVGSVPSDLAFSPDGQRLAVSYGVFGDPRQIDGAGSVRVYVVVTGHTLATRYGGHTGTVTTVAFSPDGRELLTGGNDDQVVLHDAASGAPVGPPLAMGGLVWSARFDSRGRRIAVGTSSGGASVVDLDTGIRHMLGQGTDADAAWSADGSRLAVGGNGSLQVYDAATLIADAPPIDVQTGTTSPRFTTDGRILVAGRGGPTTLWDLDGRSPLARTVPGAPAYVFPMAGDRVVAVPDIGDSVTLYDAKTLVPLGPALSPGPGPPSALPYPTTFAASYYHGNRIAVVNRAGTLQLYEVPSGRAIGAPYALGFSTVYAIFSRDMHTIAVGGRDGEVALVDLPSRRVRRLTSELDNYVDALAFTPSGDLVAADGGHAVWFRHLDRSTPEVRDLSRFTRASGVPTGSDLSPDGRTLAISAGGSVSFVELATERRIGPPVRVSDDSINWLAFSLDGSMIVTSDSSRTSRLVDVATRQLVGPKLPINVFTGPVFSGDSKTLGTSTPAGDPQPTGALLSVDPAVWRREACQLAGRNLTAAEWAKYLPGQGPRQKTCPDYL